MNDVEGCIGERHRVDIADQHLDIARPAPERQRLCRHDRSRRGVNADHRAVGEPFGKINRDGSRTDANVQHSVARFQPREKVRRGILSSPPAVRSQDGVVVTV